MNTETTLDRGLSPQRLSTALASVTNGMAVTSVDQESVGTGQMADCFRLHLTYAENRSGPSTVIAKVPSLNQSSRDASRLTRCYELETRFYCDLQKLVDVRAPQCYYVSYNQETDDFLLLLEDLAPAVQGNQLSGCSLDQAVAAVGELTRLHGPLWNASALNSMSWLGQQTAQSSESTSALFTHFYPGFVERYSDRLDLDVIELGARFVAHADRYFAAAPTIATIVHRDFRLDNLLFSGSGADCVVAVVDWQTVSQAPGVSDLSYFIGSGLLVEDRRQHEKFLVGEYQRGLRTYGIELEFDDLWNQYRLFAFSGFGMAIAASMLVKQTDRGDEMFIAMASRHGQQAIDLESELLF